MAKSKKESKKFDKGEVATSVEPNRNTTTLNTFADKVQKRGIAVRLNEQDWFQARKFALEQRSSLQQLLVQGLSELMIKNGSPPLSGK